MAALSRCVRVLGRLSLRGSPAAGGGAMIAARGECWASTVGIERDAGSSSIANARDVTRTWSVLHATRGFARGSDASMRAAGDDAGRKGSGAGDEDPGDPASDAGTTVVPDVAQPSPLMRAPAPRGMTRADFGTGLTDAGGERVARAVLRQAKGSPKKFNDVLRVIRGCSVSDALVQCALSPKKYADVVRKVILSAAANATNNHDLDRDKLFVAEAVVGKGTFLPRLSIHGRGRAGKMHRPRSHVTIVLEEREAPPKKSRSVNIREAEAPWKKHRRRAMQKYNIAAEAGLV
jgi:large subunit ribosomal protein L22|tara:strand:+ start:1727 stop:2599 length:873 start_codon:yes stop_codon:yes gene_type:complete